MKVCSAPPVAPSKFIHRSTARAFPHCRGITTLTASVDLAEGELSGATGSGVLRRGNEFGEVWRQVGDLLDHRFDAIDDRLDRVEQRLDRVEQRLELVEQRLERVEQRLDGLERAFQRQSDRIDARFDELVALIVRAESRKT